jgi:hypothetical protein
MAQTHAISRNVGVKLDTQKEKVKNSNKKKMPRKAAERRSQTEIHWQHNLKDRMETLWR